MINGNNVPKYEGLNFSKMSNHVRRWLDALSSSVTADTSFVEEFTGHSASPMVSLMKHRNLYMEKLQEKLNHSSGEDGLIWISNYRVRLPPSTYID